MELRTNPTLLGAEASFERSIAVERQILLYFYQAVLNGMAGHQELWAQDMQRVLQSANDNTYYRWFGENNK
jgi:spermidine synthase